MSEWLKISEVLPSKGQLLWIWDGKEVSQWSVNAAWGKTDEEFRSHCEKHKITHWQICNIPKPPKK